MDAPYSTRSTTVDAKGGPLSEGINGERSAQGNRNWHTLRDRSRARLVLTMQRRLRDQSRYFRSTVHRRGTGDSRILRQRTAGGLVFDLENRSGDFSFRREVFIDESRVEVSPRPVSVIDHDGAPHGWSFLPGPHIDARAIARIFRQAEYGTSTRRS